MVADNELVTPGKSADASALQRHIGRLSPKCDLASAGHGLLEEVLAKRGDAFDRKKTASQECR